MSEFNVNNKNMKKNEKVETREVINIPGVVIHPVGSESISAITKLDGDESVGNTLMRVCPTFEEVKSRYLTEGLARPEATKLATQYCLGECATRELTVQQAREQDVNCPEKNTLDALNRLGIKPEQAMIVAVTGNGVGFSDEFEQYEAEGRALTNPEGWRQVSGCNAFFADVEDCPVLACRLADCGDVNIEFKTKDGRTVIGLMHMTRPNQFGSSKFGFETPDGKKVSYFEYALEQAFEHYGDIDMDSVRVVLRTAIEKQDFVKTFTDPEKMEEVLPGWADDGYIENLDNPNWKPGEAFEPSDRMVADFRGIVEDSIISTLRKMGIDLGQYDNSDLLDTMHSDEHSSYERSKRTGTTDTRDLYITAHRSALNL